MLTSDLYAVADVLVLMVVRYSKLSRRICKPVKLFATDKPT